MCIQIIVFYVSSIPQSFAAIALMATQFMKKHMSPEAHFLGRCFLVDSVHRTYMHAYIHVQIIHIIVRIQMLLLKNKKNGGHAHGEQPDFEEKSAIFQKYIHKYTNIYEYIQNYTNTHKDYTQIHTNINKYTQIYKYTNIFQKHIQTYYKHVPKIFRKYSNNHTQILQQY